MQRIVIVGRLAAYISKALRGKNKNQYTPHMDNGDFVIVTNIEKLNLRVKNLLIKNIIDTQDIQVELKLLPHLY